eukprot:1091310-Alexandrium_andersonii.AAC.1
MRCERFELDRARTHPNIAPGAGGGGAFWGGRGAVAFPEGAQEAVVAHGPVLALVGDLCGQGCCCSLLSRR